MQVPYSVAGLSENLNFFHFIRNMLLYKKFLLGLIQDAFLTCYEVSCLKIWLFACWAKFPRRGWCMDSIHLAQLETNSLNILPYLGIKGLQLGMKTNHVRCRLKTVSHSGELLQKWNTFHLTHSWSGLEYKHLHWLKYLQPACSFIALLFWEKLQWICIPFTNSVGKSTLDQFVELSVGEDSCQSSKLGWTPIEQQS